MKQQQSLFGPQYWSKYLQTVEQEKAKMLTFSDYQAQTVATIVYPFERHSQEAINYCILGLGGEVGEILEKWKKILRDVGGSVTLEKKEELGKELGDVMWYLASLARELNLDLSEIASKNLEKLQSRKDRGVLHGSGDNR